MRPWEVGLLSEAQVAALSYARLDRRAREAGMMPDALLALAQMQGPASVDEVRELEERLSELQASVRP